MVYKCVPCTYDSLIAKAYTISIHADEWYVCKQTNVVVENITNTFRCSCYTQENICLAMRSEWKCVVNIGNFYVFYRRGWVDMCGKVCELYLFCYFGELRRQWLWLAYTSYTKFQFGWIFLWISMSIRHCFDHVNFALHETMFQNHLSIELIEYYQ